MNDKPDHFAFRRIMTAFMTTVLLFAVGFTVFCLWFIHQSRKLELRNAENPKQKIVVSEPEILE